MSGSGLGRRTRVALAGLLLAVAATTVPVANVLAAQVTPATGGEAISADDYKTGHWTSITGPTISETQVGEFVQHSTIKLYWPIVWSFKDDTGTVQVDPQGCDLIGDFQVNEATLTFTVIHPSTMIPCRLTFVGLQVRPNSGTVFGTTTIKNEGTSSAPGNDTSYGTLRLVPGAPAKVVFSTQPSPSNLANVPFARQPAVQVKDQYDNVIQNPVTTIGTKFGTGPAGANLVCAQASPKVVDGTVQYSDCKIDKPGQYKLFVTSGGIGADSDPLTVSVGPPTKLVFTVYPGATTGPTLTPQPRVAITDDEGYTVTTAPATTITLAINKNAGTFSCTGGLTAETVNGEATFTGCQQTAADTGYRLSASASFANTLGGTFAVSSAPPPTSSTLSLSTFCGTPQPISTSGANQCPADPSKSPAQANIKLPQTPSEGVRLQAHFDGGASRVLTFEVSKDQATWSPIGTATTNASGDASVFYRPSDNRYYRVSFGGAGDLGAAMSSVVRVVVRALVFIRPSGCTVSSPCGVNLGDDITFTATARPNRPELPPQAAVFTVQRRSGSTWVDADIGALVIPVSKVTGTALFNVAFSSRGTWRLRVNLAPTSVNANSFPTDYEYYTVS